jgi:hypothetical protein
MREAGQHRRSSSKKLANPATPAHARHGGGAEVEIGRNERVQHADGNRRNAAPSAPSDASTLLGSGEAHQRTVALRAAYASSP